MSRSALSFVTSRRSRSISSCSGFTCPCPGNAPAGAAANSFRRSHAGRGERRRATHPPYPRFPPGAVESPLGASTCPLKQVPTLSRLGTLAIETQPWLNKLGRKPGEGGSRGWGVCAQEERRMTVEHFNRRSSHTCTAPPRPPFHGRASPAAEPRPAAPPRYWHTCILTRSPPRRGPVKLAGSSDRGPSPCVRLGPVRACPIAEPSACCLGRRL